MNWYNLYKKAQIWNIESDGSFTEELRRLYELEYKYSFLSKSDVFTTNKNDLQFKGMPERRENILKNLEIQLRQAIDNVARPLLATFGKWLEKHALLEPEIWATHRVEDLIENFDTSESLLIILEEYRKYYPSNLPPKFNDMLMDVLNNIQEAPNFMKMIQFLKDGQKEGLREDMEYEGKSEEEIENTLTGIDNENPDDFLLNNIDVSSSAKEFASWMESLANFGLDTRGLIVEFYKIAIFPHWLDYWRNQGIEETRENIQNTYNNLLTIDSVPINQAIVYINIAINTNHQSGSMLEYLEEDIGEFDVSNTMSELSNTNQYKNWTKQLKEVGVAFKPYNKSRMQVQAQSLQNKTLVIMRGLPGSGKSHLAKQLSEGGSLISTDNAPDLYEEIDGVQVFHPEKLHQAHRYALQQAITEMKKGTSPIVIDNTNVKAWEIKPYVEMGLKHGYSIKYQEPQSPWWTENFKENMTNEEKDNLAKILSEKNEHGVLYEGIRKRLNAWDYDINNKVQGLINKGSKDL